MTEFAIAAIRQQLLLQSILANLPATAFVVSSEGIFLLAEGTQLESSGFKKQDLIGANVSKFRDVFPDIEANFRRALAGESLCTMVEAPSRRHFEVNYAPLCTDKGDIFGVLGIARDVTEKITQEQALKASEHIFRSISSTAHDAIVVLDDRGTICFWNEAAEWAFGYTSDEAQGLNLRDLIAARADSSECPLEGLLSNGIDSFGGGTMELPMRRKSGQEFPAELSMSAFQLQDQWHAVGIIRDVTERRRAEKKLRDSEQKFSKAFQSSAALMAISELESGKFLEINDSFVRHLGFSRDEVIGRSAMKLGLFADERRHHTAKDRVRRGKSLSNFEAAVRTKSGDILHGIFSAELLCVGDKNCLLTVMTDITDRKRFEEALRESENTYRAVFENTGSVMMIVEEDTTISLVNSEFGKVIGYTREEVEGKMSWTELVSKEDLEMMKKQHELRRVDPKSALSSYEFRLIGKNGVTRDMLINVDMIQGTRKSVASCLDITDRKRAELLLRDSEQNFRSIVESAPWGMHFYQLEPDESLRFVGANPVADTMLGLDHGRLIGQTMEEAFPTVVGTETPDRFRCIAREGGTWQTDGVTYKAGQLAGSYIVNAFQTSPGKVVTAFLDITESKRNQEEKEKLQRQLQQSQKLEAIGTMAGGIAHDFNNILTGIIGFAELARSETKEDSGLFENLTEVVNAGRRARDLVKQILSFSRMAETEKAPVSLVAIAKESLKLIGSISPSNIRIEQRLFASPTSMIMADSTQMHQVVMNLCINAVDAMPDGGVLEVRLEEQAVDDSGHGYRTSSSRDLVLTVRDSGQGISPEVIERIFEPYFTTKQVGKGTGMGLAVVHGVVKDHGGNIAVTSDLGRGTTVTVRLPITESATGLRDVPRSGVETGRESILFVDDEMMITKLQASQLGKWGYRVTATHSSKEALEIFRANPEDFDLVITDQTMPEMTGTRLSQAIHAIRPEIPIILCSGFDNGIVREEVARFGIRAISIKPLTGVELSRTIRRVLDERQSTELA
jgi:PAS domain S-box-containing protein